LPPIAVFAAYRVAQIILNDIAKVKQISYTRER
jgi:hypothetical protein